MSDTAQARETLAGRARVARFALLASILTGLAVFALDAALLYDDPPLALYDVYGAVDGLDTLVTLGAAVAAAFWAAALFRVVKTAAARDDLVSPRTMGWLVFLFPLTLHLPWLYLRRAARLLGDPGCARIATTTYAAEAAALLLVVLLVGGSLTAPAGPITNALALPMWLLVLIPFWLERVLIGRFTAAALVARIEDVFA